MLTESFIASVGLQNATSRTDAGKDASIVVLEYQPIVQVKSSYKKSVTPPHCLAASATHIFAAQETKAVINVYNKEKSAQEATVPFPERITCITLACADTVLIVATAEGKIFLWETASGRQVHASQAHLQAVNAVCVDSCSTFFISASADSTAQVWSLPNLLSFETDIDARSPVLTFSAHHSSIVDLAIGHSGTRQNFAASIADDKTCHLWNYNDGTILLTLLLSYIPVAVQLDAADRALYVGYDDGSLQQIDLFALAGSSSLSSKSDKQATVQPGDKLRWTVSDKSHGSMLGMCVGFDSTTVLTGHQSGSVLAWDVATGHVKALAINPPLPGPVTNLLACPVLAVTESKIRTSIIIKPKFGIESESSRMPPNYAVQMQLTHPSAAQSAFQRALTAPSVPQHMLEQGLDELSRGSQPVAQVNGISHGSADDFMALDNPQHEAQAALASENADLKRQLSSLRQVQMATFDRMDRLSAERKALLQREEARLLRTKDTHDMVDD